jgi:hypothetical protein
MVTQFKPNPGLNPAALPEWRKLTSAVQALERHATQMTGRMAGQSRTVGAVITRASTALSLGGQAALVPAAPTALTETHTGYYDATTGNPYTSVVLSWTAPTLNTDGSPLTVAGYEIWRLLTGGEWQFVTEVTGTGATLLRQPFGGASYQFEVRAQSADNGQLGDFSAPITVTPPTTLAALPAPSVPILTTGLGIVKAQWDGNLGGSPAPAGFRGVYAEISTDGGTTWTTAGQNLLTGGTRSALGPYDDGQALQVRFRAVDALGVATAASAVASTTVVGVSGPQIVAGSVTTNKIQAGQITSALIDTAGLTGITVTGGTIQTLATASRGIKIVGGILSAYDASGNATVTIDGATGAVTLVGLNATSATISGSITASSGSITGPLTVTGTLRTAASGGRVELNSSGLWAYDSAGNAQVHIATDGSLTANTGTFGGSLNGASGTFAGSLTAGSGTISGTMTVSGTIQTAASGQRLVMNSSSGYRAYSAGGGYAQLNAGSLQLFDATGNSSDFSNGGTNGLSINDEYGIHFTYRGTAGGAPNTGYLDMGGDATSAYVKSTTVQNRTYTQASALTPTGSSTGVAAVSSTGIIGMVAGTIFLPQAYSDVVSTRAVFVNTGGRLGTTSSARRTKNLHGQVEMSDEMLEAWVHLPTHLFHYKADADKVEQIGMVAEEVLAAKHFEHLIYYDERPLKSGQPRKKKKVDGLAYERMPVYNRMAIGRLYDRLMLLEKRVADLEGAR